MNKINVKVHINRLGSRVDGSLGLSMTTAKELSPQEKALFFELHNLECDMTLLPVDTPNVPEVTIDRDLDSKSPSERMRATLWRLWEQEGSKGLFKDFYHERMELLIEKLKERLDG